MVVDGCGRILSVTPKSPFTDGTVIVGGDGFVEWLRKRGVVGQVIEKVDDPAWLEGKIVYAYDGDLSLLMASRASVVLEVYVPHAVSGQHLRTCEDLEYMGAEIRTFTVYQVD